MRGEHKLQGESAYRQAGSSPHARGTPSVTGSHTRRGGIIPACAGNTDCCWSLSCRSEDHPRMRGEHPHTVCVRLTKKGSSPHARGTLAGSIRDIPRLGIIPACAGNTYWRQRVRGLRGDHPRMRGEHGYACLLVLRKWGSSPHARGTHNVTVDISLDQGIIPACAGNTGFLSRPAEGSRDHPRMRGEH